MTQFLQASTAQELPVARLGLGGRALAAGLAAGCLAVLVVAVLLTPNPSGIGTHEQLGLRPCDFKQRTGIACPTCGMTTSFACFVRGNWLASLYIQPMGAVLALGCGVMVWCGAYVAVTGRPLQRLLRKGKARYYLAGVLMLSVLAWGWKIMLQVRGIDGWH